MPEIIQVIDQMERTVAVPKNPQRIISLVPSQTELLFYLGLEEEIVGITKFCIHPSHAGLSKTIIGGTKKFRFEVIDALKPDLIIGNKEENYEEGIEILSAKYPVWMSDISNVNDALKMVEDVGVVCDKKRAAIALSMDIEKSFKQIKYAKAKSSIYFIWNNPMMVAGKNTFIDDLMERAGFINLIPDSRYPEIQPEKLTSLAPEVVMLSSEPFPFKDKHIKSYKQLFPDAQVVVVDGELFSWYGNRLLESSNYFNQLHQQLDQRL